MKAFISGLLNNPFYQKKIINKTQVWKNATYTLFLNCLEQILLHLSALRVWVRVNPQLLTTLLLHENCKTEIVFKSQRRGISAKVDKNIKSGFDGTQNKHQVIIDNKVRVRIPAESNKSWPDMMTHLILYIMWCFASFIWGKNGCGHRKQHGKNSKQQRFSDVLWNALLGALWSGMTYRTQGEEPAF